MAASRSAESALARPAEKVECGDARARARPRITRSYIMFNGPLVMASSSPTSEQFYAILARVIATIAAVVRGSIAEAATTKRETEIASVRKLKDRISSEESTVWPMANDNSRRYVTSISVRIRLS